MYKFNRNKVLLDYKNLFYVSTRNVPDCVLFQTLEATRDMKRMAAEVCCFAPTPS